MMAAWMFYCTLCALGLSLAATLAERALLAGRGAVRQVWLGALVLSVVVPVIAFRYAPRRAADTTVSAGQDLVVDEPVVDGASPATPPREAPTRSSPPRISWSATLARADQPLAVAWLTLSVALALRFLVGLIGLVRTRRNWGPRVVLGVPVLVSERTGPALVGAVSPAIVVPEWALALESGQLALMLRHEQEHQRAHDGQLLFAAQFALLAMPWNIALWWQVLRLRVAVELDCDARVLRDADARSYGSLLLDVVGRQPALAPVGAALFAEHATQLERRIRVMARRRNRALRGAHLLAGFVALAAVTIAWITPRPPVPAAPAPTPAHVAAPTPAAPATSDTLPAPATDSVRAPSPPNMRGVEATRPTRLAPPTLTSTPADSVRKGNGTLTIQSDTGDLRIDARQRGDTLFVLGPPETQTVTRLADVVFRRLFDGITLAADQNARARNLITKLLQDQAARQDSVWPAVQAFSARVAELRATRDSALFALLTNDADRATLRARVTPQGGARGRSGGAPPGQNPLGGTPGSGARMGGGGGGRGRSGGAGPADIAQVTDAVFQRLFDGIGLTPEQETRAREAIARMQTDQRALVLPPALPALVALRPADGKIFLEARADSSLMSLLTSDADRQKLRDRIVNPQ
jgi:beta-lactamase regulating signal transducer with metallopeptidase domain